MDCVSGHLEVGTNEVGDVVVNHPKLQADENGVGHIIFSPRQARIFAAILIKHAAEADNQQKLMRAIAKAIARGRK